MNEFTEAIIKKKVARITTLIILISNQNIINLPPEEDASVHRNVRFKFKKSIMLNPVILLYLIYFPI